MAKLLAALADEYEDATALIDEFGETSWRCSWGETAWKASRATQTSLPPRPPTSRKSR
jgi:hypothetical protein